MADEIHVHYVFFIPTEPAPPAPSAPTPGISSYTQWMQIPFPEDEGGENDLPRRPYPPTSSRWG